MTLTRDNVKTVQQDSTVLEAGVAPRSACVIEVSRALNGRLTVNIPKASVVRGDLIIWRTTAEDVPAFKVEFKNGTNPVEGDGPEAGYSEPVDDVRTLAAVVVNSEDRRLAIIGTDSAIAKEEYPYGVIEKLPMPPPPSSPEPGAPPLPDPPPPPPPDYSFSIIIREPKVAVES